MSLSQTPRIYDQNAPDFDVPFGYAPGEAQYASDEQRAIYEEETAKLWQEFDAGLAARAPATQGQTEVLRQITTIKEPVPQDPTKNKLSDRLRSMMGKASDAIKTYKANKAGDDKRVFGQRAALRLMKEWEESERYYDDLGAESNMIRPFASLILGGLAVGGAAYLTLRGVDVFGNRPRAPQAQIAPANDEMHDGQTQVSTPQTRTIPDFAPQQTQPIDLEEHDYDHAQSNDWYGWQEGAIAAGDHRRQRNQEHIHVERLKDEDFDN